MKLLLLMLLTLTCSAMLSCQDSGVGRWKQYSEDGVSTFSYDTQSLAHPSEQTARVWYKTRLKDPSAKGWFDSSGLKGLVEFNCADAMYRVLEIQFYDNQEKTLYTFTEASGEMPKTIWQWSHVEPENKSYGPLYQIACKK